MFAKNYYAVCMELFIKRKFLSMNAYHHTHCVFYWGILKHFSGERVSLIKTVACSPIRVSQNVQQF